MMILILLFSFFAHAESPDGIKAHHTGKVSSINLGGRYSSLYENRGIILYNDFQIDPILSVFFFDDKLEFLGDSIGYRDFVVGDRLRLRTKIQSIGDSPLFPVNSSIKDIYPHRDSGYEWQNRVEYFFGGYNKETWAEIDFGYYHEITKFNWDYFELLGKVKITEFVEPILNYHIEPNFFASIGWGDAKFNRYFYGAGASGPNLNNLEYGLWFAFPDDADRNYPVIQIKKFAVLGTENQNAGFAKNRDEGWMISFIASYGVLK